MLLFVLEAVSLTGVQRMIAAVDEPVEGLPVLLSQRDEHLVSAVELLAILHPHDVGLHHTLHSTAQPRRIPLRHCLIGWVLGEVHTCNKDKNQSLQASYHFHQAEPCSETQNTIINV